MMFPGIKNYKGIITRYGHFITGTIAMLFSFAAAGQENAVDSVQKLLNNATHDSTRVKLLLWLGETIYAEDPDSAFKLFIRTKDISERNLGKYSGKTDKEARSLRFHYSVHLANAYYDMGYLSLDKGDIPNGLEFYHQSLKIREVIVSPHNNKPDKEGIAQVLNDIGVIYHNQDDFDEALKYYNKSVMIRKEVQDKAGMAQSLNNIGVTYKNQGLYMKAFESYKSALAIQENISDKEGLAYTLNNIAAIYKDHGDPECSDNTADCKQAGSEKALLFLHRALKIHEEIQYKAGIAHSKNSIASVLLKLGRYQEALTYGKESMKLSEELRYPDNIKRTSQTLSQLYAQTGDYKNAYEMHVLYKQMADSINNENNRKLSIKKEFQYEYEKKAATDSLRTLEERKVFAARMKQEKTQRMALYIGLSLTAIFSALMYNRFRITRKQKRIIEHQKSEVEQKKVEVEKQKNIIEEKNKDITDSINYAKRIQQAKLPQLEEIYGSLPLSFVLYKPKDIVSGDFYFFRNSNNKIYIASADCTGHGVPGALMSMVASEQLNDALRQHRDPSEILRTVNGGIKASLRQSGDESSTRDGMDIALCAISAETRHVTYAGANRPIWIIRNGRAEIEEIKATKKAIGGLTSEDQHFDAHDIMLNEGDTFYLFTDGYADTFNGKTNKKLTTKQFKQLLIDIRHLTMPEQKQHLDDYIESWKSGTEQVDDILVIGVRL